jgi:hypothetical protein
MEIFNETGSGGILAGGSSTVSVLDSLQNSNILDSQRKMAQIKNRNVGTAFLPNIVQYRQPVLRSKIMDKKLVTNGATQKLDQKEKVIDTENQFASKLEFTWPNGGINP